MGEEKEILLRGKVCAYLTGRLMGEPFGVPLDHQTARLPLRIFEEIARLPCRYSVNPGSGQRESFETGRNQYPHPDPRVRNNIDRGNP